MMSIETTKTRTYTLAKICQMLTVTDIDSYTTVTQHLGDIARNTFSNFELPESDITSTLVSPEDVAPSEISNTKTPEKFPPIPFSFKYIKSLYTESKMSNVQQGGEAQKRKEREEKEERDRAAKQIRLNEDTIWVRLYSRTRAEHHDALMEVLNLMEASKIRVDLESAVTMGDIDVLNILVFKDSYIEFLRHQVFRVEGYTIRPLTLSRTPDPHFRKLHFDCSGAPQISDDQFQRDVKRFLYGSENPKITPFKIYLARMATAPNGRKLKIGIAVHEYKPKTRYPYKMPSKDEQINYIGETKVAGVLVPYKYLANSEEAARAQQNYLSRTEE